jgi:hypothetical protein
MAIEDDISVDINGLFDWTGDEATTYTVEDFHLNYIAPFAAQAQATGDDLIDITFTTPSDKKTSQIVELQTGYTITDALARHLYGGSIQQDGLNTLFSGYQLFGPVNTGTEPMITQDDKVLPAYWGTGINAVAATNVVMQILIKSRVDGADIDGKRVRSHAKEFGDTWKEFQTILGQAVGVAALTSANDLNNETAIATVRTYTDTTFTESSGGAPILIDITNDGTDEEYYIQGAVGSQTLNQAYEKAKLQVTRAPVVLEDFTNTGTAYTVDDATNLGVAQSFTTHAVVEIIREATFSLRKVGTPTGDMTAELYASTAGVIPTGAALATSEPLDAGLVLDTVTYNDIIYYLEAQGAATGNTAGENSAQDTGSWAAAAAADLYFSVKGSEVMYGRAGEMHRGITHEIVYDNETGGPFPEASIVYWGAEITYDGLVSGPWVVGDYVAFRATGEAFKNGGKILADTGTILTVALESQAGNLLNDDEMVTASGAATTSDVNGTPATGGATGQDLAGGEGVLLTLDDNGVDGDFYIQLIHGLPPVDNQEIAERGGTGAALVNVTVNSYTPSDVWLGQSTGTTILGAYGVGWTTTDVSNLDAFEDLGGTVNNPPNNVTNSVTGCVVGEDRVHALPRTGTAQNKALWTTDTTLSANNETIVSIATVAIPKDTPNTGFGDGSSSRLRVQRDGFTTHWLVPYLSYDTTTPGNFTIYLADTGVGGIAMSVDEPSGEFRRAAGSFITDGFERGHRFTSSNFTNGGNNGDWTVENVTATAITVVTKTGMVTEGAGSDERLLCIGFDFTESTHGGNATSGNEVYPGYIDELAKTTTVSYTAEFVAPRDTLTRARDGGGTPTKTDEFQTVFGSSDSSVALIRADDS